MIRFSFFLLFTVCISTGIQAQSINVYPGDANNNGVVNNVDFLYLGLAYNYAGPERDSTSDNNLSFLPSPATPWQYAFANGANFAHADCNGDGIVNYYYDAFPLYVNYGQMRPDSVTADVFPASTAGVDPSLHFDESALPPAINGGQPIELPILLGDAQTPVEDLYGIAFSVFVDPDFVDTDNMQFNFSELSWANPDNDRVSLYKKVSNERIDVAWVRTDHNQRDGYGRIGTADFIIIIDVIDVHQDFMLRIDSVKMIDKFGNETAVAGDTIVLHFSPDGQVTSTPELPHEGIRVSPNPASRHLQISSPDNIEQVVLFNALGQPVLHEKPASDKPNLSLPELPSGIYMLEIRTAGGVIIQKIRIQQ